MKKNKAGYMAQDAPSTRLREGITHRWTDGQMNGQMDGHTLLQRCDSASKNVYYSLESQPSRSTEQRTSAAIPAKGTRTKASQTEFGLQSIVQMRSRLYFYPFIILLLVVFYYYYYYLKEAQIVLLSCFRPLYKSISILVKNGTFT